MASEWTELPLEDAMDAIIDYRGKTPRKTDSGIPLITAKIVKNGRINPTQEYIAEADYDAWMQRGIPQKGDVVLTTEAPLGEVAQLNGDKIALAQRIITLRGKAGLLESDFLKYLLQSHEVQHQFDGRASGTTVSGIKQSELRKIVLRFPPLPEQKAIAHILGSLDDKIELNRRMNATLEGMAQALFKSWFVDFDPVLDNAIRAGNPIPDEFETRAEVRRQAITGRGEAPAPPSSTSASDAAGATSLPEQIRSLFPASFIETDEMGWIPEGWAATSVSEAVSVNPSTKLRKGDLAPFADMKALPTSGYAIDGVIKKAYSGGAKFKNGDVLLARITPCLENGKTGIVDFLTDDNPVGFGSTEFIVLRGNGDLTTAFIACLARDSNFRKHCEQSMIGSSGRQRVHNSCFDSYYLALPTKRDVVTQFNGLAVPAFAKAGRQSNENKVLVKLRDTLLPKLISGELRIEDAEKMVGGS